MVCVDLRAAEETAAQIAEDGGRADAVTMDVTDSAAWGRCVERAQATFGPVMLLANVAGIVSRGPDTALEQTEEECHYSCGERPSARPEMTGAPAC